MYRYYTLKTCIAFFIFSFQLLGQEKIVDHTVYNSWSSLSHTSVSSNGKYISYQIAPHRGDGALYIYNSKTEKERVIPRGNKASFCHNEDLIVFKIHPGYDTLRTLELEKVKKDKWVKDTLGILWLETDSLVKVPNAIDYKIGKDGNHVAYRVLKDSLVEEKKKKRWRLFKKKKEVKLSSDGNTLFVLNTLKNEIQSFENVVKYGFNTQGTQLFFSTHQKKDKQDEYQIHLYDISNGNKITYDSVFFEIGPTTFSEKGQTFAFLASLDTAKETRLYDLYLWSVNESYPKVLVGEDRADLPENLTPSKHSRLWFSLDDKKLFLGLHDIPVKAEKDTLLDSEKAKLDVWHYQNKRLQPQQLKELKRDQNASQLTVIHLEENKLVQLGEDTLKVRTINKGNSDYALATSNERYAHANNWSYPWPNDYYRVDLKSGSKKLIKEKVNYGMRLTPNGKYFVYFNSKENQYYRYDVETDFEECMTCLVKDSINWRSDVNGMPFEANPEGIAGFTSEDEIILYSEYDIWQYNFVSKQLRSISLGRGKEENKVFRLNILEHDSVYIDLANTLIIGVDQDTQDESVYTFNDVRLNPHLIQWYNTDHKLYGFKKARSGDVLIFRQMNVKDYPELHVTNMKFESPKKISETNPQQAEYVWPTVEQVEWTSYDGKELKGLLYKPDNYDSTKSYPLMVYFYELYSDRKNYHYIPKPTASIIFATEYASAGYLVFFPDIRYEPGYPARGAYNSIMSGTDKILELYPNIDSTRMGLQGQSWGGYQTAQLITMTDRYAAAMAGAPVSNMFSAYGGIRWGSGLNRAFQYERTQSRIGKTIWEAPELYVENSPLFGVPNINTPLLIMHNDNDGAVPWYQGIEMFTAMKRLNKPVWMLNYNGDEHNLMINANRVDLSIRMRQFFDHYLQGKPAPEWLIKGVPAIDKGKNYGLGNYE